MGKLFGTIIGALTLLGMPLFAVLGGISILSWLTAEDENDRVLRRIAANVLDDKFANSTILVTIPLFVFVGYLMAESKAPQRIVKAASSALGWLPGGLGIVCVIVSAVFTMLTGGSGVTIVAIGGLLLPVLIDQGYPKKFSLGLVTTAGAVGLLLPPSPLVLIYCYVTRVDVKRTYYATLWPGLVLIAILSLYCVYEGVRHKVPRQKFSAVALAQDVWGVKWEALAPVLVLVGLGTTMLQLHESAAAAAFYTLIAEVYITKDLSWKKVLRIAKDAMSLAGAIIVILAMATALTNYVITAEIPLRLLDWFVEKGMSELWHFIVILNLFLFVMGMLMDAFSVLLVALPLLVPLAANFGMHPFYLAVMFLLNLEIAYITPPVGLNLYIASFRFRRPVTEIYRVVLPFVGLLMFGLAIVIFFPRLSSFTIEDDVARLKAEAESKGEKPIEAWKLECIQQDPVDIIPCSAEEIAKYTPAAAEEDAAEAEDLEDAFFDDDDDDDSFDDDDDDDDSFDDDDDAKKDDDAATKDDDTATKDDDAATKDDDAATKDDDDSFDDDDDDDAAKPATSSKPTDAKAPPKGSAAP